MPLRRMRLDVVDLNEAACEGLADKIRSDVRRFERLGLADHPDMTYVEWCREYLRRYDADRGVTVSGAGRTLRAVK